MTKKLTGREAVIALLDGKKIKTYEYTIDEVIFYIKDYSLFSSFEDKTEVHRDISDILLFDHWEIVPEPMVWEGEAEPDFHSLDVLTIMVPKEFDGKRVKVRIEEIL